MAFLQIVRDVSLEHVGCIERGTLKRELQHLRIAPDFQADIPTLNGRSCGTLEG